MYECVLLLVIACSVSRRWMEECMMEGSSSLSILWGMLLKNIAIGMAWQTTRQDWRKKKKRNDLMHSFKIRRSENDAIEWLLVCWWCFYTMSFVEWIWIIIHSWWKNTKLFHFIDIDPYTYAYTTGWVRKSKIPSCSSISHSPINISSFLTEKHKRITILTSFLKMRFRIRFHIIC